MRAIVLSRQPSDHLVIGRTLRMLRQAGIPSPEHANPESLAALLANPREPVWLIQSGAWRTHDRPLREIPPSATGREIIGVGHGGLSLYLVPSAARAFAELLGKYGDFDRAQRKLLKLRAFRVVPLYDIDVMRDPRPRVVQLVTSIQMGGAERVALDLTHGISRLGWTTVLFAIGAPSRRSYAPPPEFIDLSTCGSTPQERAEAVDRHARICGADVIHAHLICAETAEALRAYGWPLAITVHNSFPVWPEGYADAAEPFADLLIGCSRAVSADIQARQPRATVRTVWNGIDPDRTAPTPPRLEAGKTLRRERSWSDDDFVLLSIANPRPQKLLHRLPEIAAELEKFIAPRRVRLLLAGEPAARNPIAAECMQLFRAEAERCQLAPESIHWAGAVDDVAPLMHAADALIAVSSHEGLSLAQLEAVAAGLPVVATEVGGAREVATKSPLVSLLPAGSPAADFAHVLATCRPARTPALPPDFTRDTMARRTQTTLLPLLVPPKPTAVWLITNNFTTGGAQSSARRLLLALHASGYPVRAATIEEWPDAPTAGAQALHQGGVEVATITPRRESAAMVAELFAHFAAHPPRAVVFWNLCPPVKVLLAELLSVPVYDISPGEMLFRSLGTFFAQCPAGSTIETPREYGQRLAGVVVKYGGEAERAATELGAPVSIIRNGLPLPELQPRTPGRELIIGTTARLSPDKKLEQLIESFRLALPRLPRCRLLIAGGPDGDTGKSYARELKGLARGLPVKWCGETREVPGFLRGLDLFAMISEPAGCPNASLEAMAAGLPVIATDHGGAREQVLDGITGRLVPRGEVSAFADALVELAHSAALRQRLGAAAREHVRREFSVTRMAQQYADLLGLTEAPAPSAQDRTLIPA